jgi:hypothetical protein
MDASDTGTEVGPAVWYATSHSRLLLEIALSLKEPPSVKNDAPVDAVDDTGCWRA